MKRLVLLDGATPMSRCSPTWPGVTTHVNAAIVRRSLVVALIVGPTLLWVNQGPLFFFDPALDYYKAALTFCVPFIVSLVSGTAARIEASIGRR